MQQGARVFEHDARLVPLGEQGGNELAHAGVAVAECGRVVVVADPGVLEHRLQVADQRRGAQIVAAGRGERLVHVQRDGAGAADPVERNAAFVEEHGAIARCGNGALDQVFGAAQVRQSVHGLGERGHRAAYLWRMNS